MAIPPYGVYGIPNTPHVRTGHMYSYQPASGNYADIKDSEQRQQPVPPVFEAKRHFYDVAYPYWQWPFKQGPFVQAQKHGFKYPLRLSSYVGAPLPQADYQYQIVTAYNPKPY